MNEREADPRQGQDYFFDLWLLARQGDFKGTLKKLGSSLIATFGFIVIAVLIFKGATIIDTALRTGQCPQWTSTASFWILIAVLSVVALDLIGIVSKNVWRLWLVALIFSAMGWLALGWKGAAFGYLLSCAIGYLMAYRRGSGAFDID